MDFGRWIDRKLQEARESGAFDNLPRKGRLDLSDEDLVPDEERLAFIVLKNNDTAPAWIEDDKVLRNKLLVARTAIYKAYLQRRTRLAAATTAGERMRAEDDWAAAKTKFEAFVAEINKDIFNFNLNAPSLAVHRMPLRATEEYARLERMADES